MIYYGAVTMTRPNERKKRNMELAAISLLVFLLTVTACLFLFSAYVHLS